MLRLLITGGGGSASQAIYDLWKHKYDLYFADANPCGFPPNIPKARRLTIPKATDECFAAYISSTCAAYEIDLLIPTVDEELLPLAAIQHKSDCFSVLVPPMHFIEMTLDKLKFAQSLLDAGIDVPKTVPISQARDISFPLIAKPRFGRGSREVVRLDSYEQVAAYLALSDGEPNMYVAQELAQGKEYTVFVATGRQAELAATVPVLIQDKRGITIRGRTEPNHVIQEYIWRFQKAFRPTGIYNLQCIVSDTGRVLPFEINPRISTTFPLVLASGYDPIPIFMADKEVHETYVPGETWEMQRSWMTVMRRASRESSD